ncbi:MAG: hypothetical protein UV78_C0011G0008 [Parcubacteria group bacterium GW2011_GWA2_43_17]|nr:MAG: hypothetical protein UV78_C0011G0008 [Parcubacteria group bacterium GW2011_GWA2_43_17]HBR13382.1 hypothetical protein [Candidatus Komeilibacteria bacterium]
MVQIIKWPRYLVISLILTALNLIMPEELKYFSGILYLLFFAFVFGNWLFIKNSLSCKLLFGFLFLLSLASIIGSAFFYFGQLTLFSQTVTLILIPALLLPLVLHKPLVIEWPNKILGRVNPKIFFLTLAYFGFLATIVYLLTTSQTDASIRSPWEVVPPEIFLLYFFASFILLAVLFFSRSRASVLLVSVHFFISFSVAWLVYKIGFDYDPFIHQTNETLIWQTGTLLPKPFYYIGQYSLIIFLGRLLNLSLVWLDKLLVPLLAAVYLPLTVYHAFKDNFKFKTNHLAVIVGLLLFLPFTNFISTTPQSLANTLFLITIFLSLYFLAHPRASFWPLLVLALTTFLVHPLAGIPCLFFVILLLLYHRFRLKIPSLLHQGIFWELFIIACLALPAAFLINAKTVAQLQVGLNSHWPANLIVALTSADLSLFYRPYINVYDLIYNYGNNLVPLFFLLTIVGLWYLSRRSRLKIFVIYICLSFILLINYVFLVAGLSFFNLLSSEQQIYPARILSLSAYSLLPFLVFGLYLILQKVIQQKGLFILLLTALTALALTNSFYLSYPRVDQITEDHGYSTSATDVKTVNFLEQLNQGQPYVVLAAQPISAAAIKTLGFKYYYNGFYFYPVPTGERLYQLYEDLAYNNEKTADVMATVRYLTGVNTVYFILTDYWFNASDLILQHKDSADHWYAIDGKNFIFEYVN